MKANWMWIIGAVLVSASLARADVVFQDHFLGDSLDGAKWTSAGTVTVASSKVTVTQGSSIRTIDAFQATDGDYTIDLTGWGSGHNKFVSVGFSDAAGNNLIKFTTNETTKKIDVAMRSGGGPLQTYALAIASNNSVFLQGDWTMTMSGSQVTFVSDNAWTSLFDTSNATFAPTTNGPSWVIPTAEMNFVFHSGGLGSNGPLDAVSIDLVPVPEPASLALIGAAGLLMLVRRRKV